jgi:hypothetical protein
MMGIGDIVPIEPLANFSTLNAIQEAAADGSMLTLADWQIFNSWWRS